AAESRSLLHFSTIEGFQSNHRGLGTLIIGLDISITIAATVAVLKTARTYHPGPGGQRLVLEKLFYIFCNFLRASITIVAIFDGPGRPSVKRGTRVVHRVPPDLIPHLKAMITYFGFHFYDAPGEAEAELGQLSEQGKIDGIITGDSDAFLFGAQRVIRTSGPTVQHHASIYTMDSIQRTLGVNMDKDGLLLCALLIGGDYDTVGIRELGPTIAHALATLGFGQELVQILRSFRDAELQQHLTRWRDALRWELRTNSAGRLGKRHGQVADNVPDTFPNLRVVDLYLNPLTSGSPQFFGAMPDVTSWKPTPPDIRQIATFCSLRFGWSGHCLLKKLHNNLWPGVTFRLLSSVRSRFSFGGMHLRTRSMASCTTPSLSDLP
ncbi:PIN domain-like protein, partial [Mycena crocata]